MDIPRSWGLENFGYSPEDIEAVRRLKKELAEQRAQREIGGGQPKGVEMQTKQVVTEIKVSVEEIAHQLKRLRQQSIDEAKRRGSMIVMAFPYIAPEAKITLTGVDTGQGVLTFKVDGNTPPPDSCGIDF